MSFILQPISYLFIIFLSYFLKRAGVFRREHAMIVMRILLYITLPAITVVTFADFDRDMSLLFLILIGLGASLGSYLLMYVLTPKMETRKRIYYIISVSGFNIGCYGLPIITAFFGSLGSVVCILFDIGNGLMINGGNYAVTSVLLKTDEEDHSGARDIVKRFFSSVPTDVYLILIVLTLLGISVPHKLADFISPLAQANAFLAMFMLGLLFTLPRHRSDWKSALQILAFRLVVQGGLAILLFFVLPFSLEIRQILVLILLCPIASMSPGFIERCHGDGELASFTNSLSTIVSMILMTLVAGMIF